MFHAILCFVSLVPDIRLNALTFKFFTTSGIHSVACRLLILLQLPPHFFVLLLKEKKIDPSLLTLTICGLTLHPWLFIEIQLNEFMPAKVDKNANPVKKTF